jgi:hypothetical protein
VGSTGLVIGGFTEVKAEDTQAAGGEFSIDLLNFFLIYDYSPRFRAVAELQLRDIFLTNKERTGTQDFAFDVRRPSPIVRSATRCFMRSTQRRSPRSTCPCTATHGFATLLGCTLDQELCVSRKRAEGSPSPEQRGFWRQSCRPYSGSRLSTVDCRRR